MRRYCVDMPTFGSLFAGIGGIDLGLERAGWTGRWQVEYEPFCQRVLAKHWPDVTRYGDIHDVDWNVVEPVDLVAGGFPCQPVSYAGRGLAQDDERWLWPQFLRAVRVLRPRLVLVENVPGLLSRGLDIVLGDLAEVGYDAEWDCIPAAAVGAPHLRDRVWIVAYADGLGQGWSSPLGPSGLARLRQSEAGPEPDGASVGTARVLADVERRELGVFDGARRPPGAVPWNGGQELADTSGQRLPRSGEPLGLCDTAEDGCGEAGEPLDGRVRNQWSAEPDVGRVAHGVPARVDRLRSLGNAVVPQVVEVIGRRLMEAMA